MRTTYLFKSRMMTRTHWQYDIIITKIKIKIMIIDGEITVVFVMIMTADYKITIIIITIMIDPNTIRSVMISTKMEKIMFKKKVNKFWLVPKDHNITTTKVFFQFLFQPPFQLIPLLSWLRPYHIKFRSASYLNFLPQGVDSPPGGSAGNRNHQWGWHSRWGESPTVVSHLYHLDYYHSPRWHPTNDSHSWSERGPCKIKRHIKSAVLWTFFLV